MKDLNFSSTPEDFPDCEKLTGKVMPRIEAIYREKAIIAMSMCSIVNCLIGGGAILTSDMMKNTLGKAP